MSANFFSWLSSHWQDGMAFFVVFAAVGYLVVRSLPKKGAGKGCASGSCQCDAKKLVSRQP